jgi:hypothetical protein
VVATDKTTILSMKNWMDKTIVKQFCLLTCDGRQNYHLPCFVRGRQNYILKYINVSVRRGVQKQGACDVAPLVTLPLTTTKQKSKKKK